MPVTPLHPVAPWLAYVRWPTRFSFWALTIGSMVSDLEFVPLLAATGDVDRTRSVMHSLLGVLTLNAAITVLAAVWLVPPVLRWAERKWPGTPDLFRFAGRDLRRDSRRPLVLYASAVFGGLTHLLIDLPTHGHNPLLWPWEPTAFTILPFADDLAWDLLAGVPFLIAFVWMMSRYWRH